MTRKKKNENINIEVDYTTTLIEEWLSEIRKFNLPNTDYLLIDLDDSYAVSQSRLKFIRRNVDSINTNKKLTLENPDLPNSTATLMAKLIEYGNEFLEEDSDNYNAQYLFDTIAIELIKLNNDACSKLKDLDYHVLGMVKKSLLFVMSEIPMMNIYVQKYMEANNSIENFSLEEFLTNFLESEEYSEEFKLYIKDFLDQKKAKQDVPKLTLSRSTNGKK